MNIAWDSLKKRHEELSHELAQPGWIALKDMFCKKNFLYSIRFLQKHQEIVDTTQQVERCKTQMRKKKIRK